MPRAGDVVAGKYRIEEVIGEGGMGAVFAATHALTGKRVAIKWMHPELAGDEGAVQRFVREAQAAGRIDHPNVVDIYDVGEHEGSTFLVMEYLQGETLTRTFDRGGLEVRQIIQLLIPAMRGVAAANKMGVVHRDLKPDNIFLCREVDGAYREPKVLDFGISKLSVGDGQLNPRLTRTGAVMGTPYYMSPEQIRGSSDVDQRTDVYAFGVILYEALTGRVPFDAESYGALVLEIATATPKRPRDLRPQLPRALEDAVLKAMARDPAQRFPSVEALARALEPFAEGVAFRVDRADPTGPQRDTATPFMSEAPVTLPVRRGSTGIVAGVALALVVLGIWGLLRLSDEPEADAGNTVRPAAAHQPAAATAPVQAVAPAPALAGTQLKDAGAGVEAPRAADAANPSDQRALERRRSGAPATPHTEPRRQRSSPAVDPAAQRPTARPPARSSGRTGGLKSDEF